MKKFLICVAALLPSLWGYSQEITLVSRVEYSSVEDDHLGNSSFYALIDGEVSDNMSYSVATHLLSSDPLALYKDSFKSNTTNWLDWAYLTYDTGKFQFEVGKNVLNWGTFEMQEYDFDCYYELQSLYWYGDTYALPNTYQWGVKASWLPTENQILSLQLATSPLGERPFASGLFSLNAMYSQEELDWYNSMVSFNAIQDYEGGILPILNFGHKFMAGDFSLTWDGTFQLQKNSPMSNVFSLGYTPLENLSFTAKTGCEPRIDEDGSHRLFAGLLTNWYPVEDLRLHAFVAYNRYHVPGDVTDYGDGLSFNLGLTWTISL